MVVVVETERKREREREKEGRKEGGIAKRDRGGMCRWWWKNERA